MTDTLRRVRGRTSPTVQPEAVAISITTSSLAMLAMTCLTRGSAARAAASTERSKRQLAGEVGHGGRLAQVVEVVRAPTGDGHHRRGRRLVGDRPRLAGGLLEVADRDVVGVGVSGADAGLGPHPGPLAHVARGLFDRTFLQYQLFVDTVLEVDVRVVDPAPEGRAEQPLHERRRHVEAIGEEALRTLAGKIIHSPGSSGCAAGPNASATHTESPTFAEGLRHCTPAEPARRPQSP